MLTPRKLSSDKIAVVIPCYKVERHILALLERMPPLVDHIYCIDDACPNGSGKLIEEQCRDPRVRVIFHDKNQGVGGAVMSGYRAAYKDACAIAVKVDGDGQMDPALIPRFVAPILKGQCDYAKGNRFYSIDHARQMPIVRLLGNALLSFFAKLSTGYWNLFDPTNGYTAIHLSLLELLPLDKIARRYFFESDMLFRLNANRCVVRDITMRAHYGDERSGLKIFRVIPSFLAGHGKNLVKRLFYNYYLRDFQVASIEFVVGPILLLIGVVYAAYHWRLALSTGVPATAGTVMIGGLQIILGVQFILSALHFDISNIPTDPIYPSLQNDLCEQQEDEDRLDEAGGEGG